MSRFHTFALGEKVRHLEFSPFGCNVSIKSDDDHWKPEIATIFKEESVISNVAWGPHSFEICLAVACYNLVITIWWWNFDKEPLSQSFAGHTDNINAMVFCPDGGSQLVSVSDDHSCRIWDTTSGLEKLIFWLTSPGMSVTFSPYDVNKFMVGEKKGLLRFYDLKIEQPLFSVTVQSHPLLAADWCKDAWKLASSSGKECIIWDVNSFCQANIQQTIPLKFCRLCRFARNSHDYLAAIEMPNHEVKVIHLHTKQVVLNVNVKVFGGLSWHNSLPYLAIGNKNQIQFWLIKMN